VGAEGRKQRTVEGYQFDLSCVKYKKSNNTKYSRPP
jgi:hypothetical protein